MIITSRDYYNGSWAHSKCTGIQATPELIFDIEFRGRKPEARSAGCVCSAPTHILWVLRRALFVCEALYPASKRARLSRRSWFGGDYSDHLLFIRSVCASDVIRFGARLRSWIFQWCLILAPAQTCAQNDFRSYFVRGWRKFLENLVRARELRRWLLSISFNYELSSSRGTVFFIFKFLIVSWNYTRFVWVRE